MRIFAVLVVLVLGWTPVWALNAGVAHKLAPGTMTSGVQYELIGRYDTARLDRILSSELATFMTGSNAPGAVAGKFAPARYAVRLYRVTYASVVPEWGNRPTRASGLIAVPETGARAEQPLPMVSYQHGTVFDSNWVPSQPDNSTETRIMIARFAAQGYVVIGADYFGRGTSDLPDSYLVKASTQQATTDMLFAARDVMAALRLVPGKLFVSGWSQGGWATMVFLQKLEELGIPVTAAAAESAPVDLYLTTNRWMNNPQPVDAVYLPGCTVLQLFAQQNYLQESGLAAAAIRPEFLAAATALYNGTMTWEAFLAATPSKLADFIQPAFAASGMTGQTPYWRALQDSQAYRWKRVTPLRTYYGGHDEVTPEYIGKLPAATQALLGGAVTQAVDAGAAADHRGVFVFGVIDQGRWFDTMLEQEEVEPGVRR